MLKKPIALGFSGEMGSGKTVASTYLAQEYGLQYVRYSQVLREWLQLTESKSDLQLAGTEVMLQGGQIELNRQVLLRLGFGRNVVIDGLRHPLDVRTLRSHFGPGFRLIFICAPDEVRYERLTPRFGKRESFVQAGAAHSESHIRTLRGEADLVLANVGTLTLMLNAVDSYYRQVVGGAR